MPVLIKTVDFVVQVRNEEVHPAVLVHVGGINAHPRARLTLFAEGNACREPDLLKALPRPVDKKEVGDGVIGYGEIYPAIIIYIRGHPPPGLTGIVGDSDLLRD